MLTSGICWDFGSVLEIFFFGTIHSFQTRAFCRDFHSSIVNVHSQSLVALFIFLITNLISLLINASEHLLSFYFLLIAEWKYLPLRKSQIRIFGWRALFFLTFSRSSLVLKILSSLFFFVTSHRNILHVHSENQSFSTQLNGPSEIQFINSTMSLWAILFSAGKSSDWNDRMWWWEILLILQKFITFYTQNWDFDKKKITHLVTFFSFQRNWKNFAFCHFWTSYVHRINDSATCTK